MLLDAVLEPWPPLPDGWVQMRKGTGAHCESPLHKHRVPLLLLHAHAPPYNILSVASGFLCTSGSPSDTFSFDNSQGLMYLRCLLKSSNGRGRFQWSPTLSDGQDTKTATVAVGLPHRRRKPCKSSPSVPPSTRVRLLSLLLPLLSSHGLQPPPPPTTASIPASPPPFQLSQTLLGGGGTSRRAAAAGGEGDGDADEVKMSGAGPRRGGRGAVAPPECGEGGAPPLLLS
ncbi:hypothetical protein ACP70R_012240 [Stipagrostis hirtigluma subsp. patula]